MQAGLYKIVYLPAYLFFFNLRGTPMHNIDFLMVAINTILYSMFIYMGWKMWMTKRIGWHIHALRIFCTIAIGMLLSIFWVLSYQGFDVATASIPFALTLPTMMVYHKYLSPQLV